MFLAQYSHGVNDVIEIAIAKANAILSRHIMVAFIDVSIAAFSLIIALYLRVGSQITSEMRDGLAFALPLFVLVSCCTFYIMGLHRQIWRYASMSDLLGVAQATTLSIVGLLIILLLLGRLGWMPRSIPVIQWFVQFVLLCGIRVTRRVITEYRSGTANPPRPIARSFSAPSRALLVGSSDRVEMLIRLIERNPETGFKPIGILTDEGGLVRMKIRGVPILGSIDLLDHVVKQLEADGQRPESLIMADAAERLRGAPMVGVVAQAESLGIKVACLPKLAELDISQPRDLDFRFVNIAALLGRPQAKLDSSVVEQAISGRRVLVTGAGGTIGRELVRQIAAFAPAQLLLLDSCEFNLYEVDLEMQESHPGVARTALLCSVRQRQQLMRIFRDHRPELVFHAAALKHVPLVEEHPCAGIQTNVLGTRNVADAAQRYGVLAMVQVSTDKAVNPVGLMGATKRLGELYCQALDLEGRKGSPRFLTVRFGNVLGSSGSLIPLFQRQLSRGAALTVTHPDIRRYFMTVHEAVQLILHGTARGLSGGIRRGRIFVLDMGEPIKVMDIAERMIRLAGLEPDTDVKIDIVGLRPGEKLYEELFNEDEQRLPSALPGIFEAEPSPVPLGVLNDAFDQLAMASSKGDAATSRALVTDLLRKERKQDAEIVRFVLPPLTARAGTALRAE